MVKIAVVVFFFFNFIFFFTVVGFVIHWNESAMDLHVLPISWLFLPVNMEKKHDFIHSA